MIYSQNLLTIAVHLMLKKYYQISCQLIENQINSNYVLLKLIAKLHAYGLSEDAVTFVYSYLKCRKQGAKINDTESVFQILLSGIPKGSILGPILCNIFKNYLFLLIKDIELANFADANTIYAARNSIEELFKVLEN